MKNLLCALTFLSFNAAATCMMQPIIECISGEEFMKVDHVQCAAPRGPVSHSLLIRFNLDGVSKSTSFQYAKAIQNEQYFLLTSKDPESEMFFHLFHSKDHAYFLANISDYNSDVILSTQAPYSLQNFKCHFE